MAFALIGFAYAGTASAQMGMMNTNGSVHNEAIDAMILQITESQNITDPTQIDCSKVSNEQFESLGDAFMQTMASNDKQHEAMDSMMGGEGSESLTQAHRNMGQSYLGCSTGRTAVAMPMMANNGMMQGMQFQGIEQRFPHQNTNMNWDNMNRGNMKWHGQGTYAFSALHIICAVITTLLVWTLLVVWILTLLKGLRKK